MSKEKKLQIRNSTAEFLIFTRQNSIEVRVEEETVWLTKADGRIICGDRANN